MTTQPIIKKPKTWIPVESANFFKFARINDSIEGLFIERQTGDKMTFYKMKTFDGKDIKFHGSKQLDDLMYQFTPPCYLKITWIGESETANGTMKTFELCKGEN